MSVARANTFLRQWTFDKAVDKLLNYPGPTPIIRPLLPRVKYENENLYCDEEKKNIHSN